MTKINNKARRTLQELMFCRAWKNSCTQNKILVFFILTSFTHSHICIIVLCDESTMAHVIY